MPEMAINNIEYMTETTILVLFVEVLWPSQPIRIMHSQSVYLATLSWTSLVL